MKPVMNGFGHPMPPSRYSMLAAFVARKITSLGLIGVVFTAAPILAQQRSFDSFTAPYRTINVASPEMGVIQAILIDEGDSVRPGDPIVVLDNETQTNLLAIADKQRSLQGQLLSAQVDLDLRDQRLQKLLGLLDRGHARHEEIDRARADRDMAAAAQLSALEQQALWELEYVKVQAQLERRTIRSPADGVVLSIEKHVGEFVSPTDPHVLTIVQLERLSATFSIPEEYMQTIQAKDSVTLQIAGIRKPIEALVEFVSPVIEAESETVLVKVTIDNRQGELKSGQRCVLLLLN